MLCNSCSRPMRPQKSDPAKYPGTIVHGAYGDCKTCYSLKRRGQQPQPTREYHGAELWERLPGSVRAYLTERRRRLGQAA
jgi:hypothetical protein